MNRAFILAVVACSLVPAAAPAAEGKWTPEQVLELDRDWLQQLGLEVEPEALWSLDHGGLLEACVNLRGCSAAFVSTTGLVLTNYHCAFSLIQQHSSPERDLISDGFLAAAHDDELSGEGLRVTVPQEFRDVTAAMLAAVPEEAGDLERYDALERRRKELVAACEAVPHRRCEVVAEDDGVRWVLVEALEFPDVRLVWAPSRDVGEYGGEVDNWMWPRHTGDFALLRVWADEDNLPAPPSPGSRPYRPRQSFPVTDTGVRDASFVMVPGFPWRTYRRLTAAEMAVYAELGFPARAELYDAWLAIMEAASRADDEARIALASRVKRLANGAKNARGQIAGIRRGNLVERARQLEAEVLAWAATRPEQAGAAPAQWELEELAAARRATFQRDFLLQQMERGPLPLKAALQVVRWVRERARPDLERLDGFQDRDRDRVADDLRNLQASLHVTTEMALMEDLLRRAASLPQGRRIAAFDPFTRPEQGADTFVNRARALVAGSLVTNLDARLAMLDETEKELRARRDTMLDLALFLDDELRRVEEAENRRDGAFALLRPQWRRAVADHRDRPLDPDANGTLRVSFGTVRGYEPRDAVWMLPQTTLSGLVAKNTGAPPFNTPAAVVAAARTARHSRWADPELGDVPVAFLADADTTGGNSGSPVLNGRGELVGLNFDRVWENVANDWGYNPAIARNVSVDIRYMLWLLETVHETAAIGLLTEMGVAPPAPSPTLR